MQGLGLKPSPPSDQYWKLDRLLGAVRADAPDEHLELVQHVLIHDQYELEACVGFAAMQAHRVFLRNRGYGDASLWYSPLFPYWEARELLGEERQDAGCVPAFLLSALTQRGFCDEKYWPTDATAEDRKRRVLERPSWLAYKAAFDQRSMEGYYNIGSSGNDRINDLKMALSQGYPVMYGSPVNAAFDNYTSGILTDLSGPSRGGHMRCIVGYTPDYFIEANSWGTGWGEQGLCRMSYGAIASDLCYDFWVFKSVVPVSG